MECVLNVMIWFAEGSIPCNEKLEIGGPYGLSFDSLLDVSKFSWLSHCGLGPHTWHRCMALIVMISRKKSKGFGMICISRFSECTQNLCKECSFHVISPVLCSFFCADKRNFWKSNNIKWDPYVLKDLYSSLCMMMRIGLSKAYDDADGDDIA